MKKEQFTYAFVLGSHPELAFAELQAVFASERLPVSTMERKEHIAMVRTVQSLNHETLMNRLGGTIKIVEIIGVFGEGEDFDEERMVEWLMGQINTETKFHFGFSLYPLAPDVRIKKLWPTIHTLGLHIKRILKEDDISSRFVESREPALSSVIVHKERLLKNGVEMVLFKDHHGIQFGKTLGVQHFKEFSDRDFGRPGRDARSGMLPPKVARMMINLSQPEKKSVLLDPFCGSGTIVQEAVLMGFAHVIGADQSARAIQDTKRNLEWLKLPAIPLHQSNAQDLLRKRLIQQYSIDRIVFEGSLGPTNPRPQQLKRIIADLTALYTESLRALARTLRNGGILVAALPFWHFRDDQHLPIEQLIRASQLHSLHASLLYRRPQSTVGREIIVIGKR